MARLPRLVVPGLAHWIVQRSQGGQALLAQAADRELLLTLVARAAASRRVLLHAYALLDQEVQLLCTPPDVQALGRMLQDVGRRFVGAYNQRHRRSGPLWDGRFRCAVVAPGAAMLDVLCLIDRWNEAATDPPRTSAGQRLGETGPVAVVDPPEYWALGNTPFDREQAYRERLAVGLTVGRAQTLRSAALGGWAIGDPDFAARVSTTGVRPAAPRPRGRPRRAST